MLKKTCNYTLLTFLLIVVYKFGLTGIYDIFKHGKYFFSNYLIDSLGITVFFFFIFILLLFIRKKITKKSY